MKSRVLFIDDKTSHGLEDSKVKKNVYSRVVLKSKKETTFSTATKKIKDPLLYFTKFGRSEDVDVGLTDCVNMKLQIDMLLINENDFVQYRGEITPEILENLKMNNLTAGIETKSLYVWMFGLFLYGNYDDGENYRFEMVKIEKGIYLAVKFLHQGLFKVIFNLELTKQKNIDLDEYFLEDLESFYHEAVETRNKEKMWEVEREKYLQEIAMLKEGSEIGKLRTNVRYMKSRIMEYFLPLVNYLLQEKKALTERIEESTDIVFTSRKRKVQGEAIIQNENGDITTGKGNRKIDSDFDFEFDWIEQERNKRMKLGEMPDDKDRKINTKFESSGGGSVGERLGNGGGKISTSSYSEVEAAHKKESYDTDIKTQPNMHEILKKHGAGNNEFAKEKDSPLYVLDEETQVDNETQGDDETELSAGHNDNTDISQGELTEVSE